MSGRGRRGLMQKKGILKRIANHLLIAFLVLSVSPLSAFSMDNTGESIREEGITCLYVNPYGGEKEDIDTIKWFFDGEDYHLFIPSDTDPNIASVYYDLTPEKEGDVTPDGVYLEDILLENGKPNSELLAEGDKTLTCEGKEYNLHIHRSENVPAVYMSTASGTLEYIHADKSNKEEGAIRIYEEGAKSLDSQLKQIKGRGNATWASPKKPYNIKFDKKTSVLGMEKAKKWTLLANYIDPSLLRNPYGWELAKAFGLPYTSDYRYVDVFINGEYLGNYIVCESVEVGENRIDIDDLDKANERANPGINISELSQIGTGENGTIQSGQERGSAKWTDIPVEPENISGGYLLELDFPERYDEEPSGFVTSYGQSVVIKSPEYASEGEVRYISELFEDATEALYSTSGYNKKGHFFTEYFDMDSFARMYILQELAQDWDSDTSSFFLVKPCNTEKMIVAPVWDFDNAFASNNNALKYRDLTKAACYWYAGRKTLYRESGEQASFHAAACTHKGFREKVCSEWAEITKDNDIEIINNRMCVLSDELSKTAVMDAVRWNTFGSREDKQCNEKYKNETSEISAYVSRREGYLINGFSDSSSTVILDSNGGEVSDQHYFNKRPIALTGDRIIIDVSALDYVTAPANTQFIEWNTKRDGSGERYMPGEVIELDGSEVLLYAIWEAAPEQKESAESDSPEREKAELVSAKTAALEHLNEIDLSSYIEPERSRVITAITTARNQINSAMTVAAVNDVIAAAESTIKAQPKYNAKLPMITAGHPRGQKGSLKARWRGLSKRNRNKVTGVEIQYSIDKKYKKAQISRARRTSTTKSIGKLNRKKTYWVRMRTYKTKNGIRTVGKWSGSRKVKTK